MLFYLTGLLGWNYFAQIFQNTSGTLVTNAGLFGKVYFPRSGRSVVGCHLEFIRLRTPARDSVGGLDLFQAVHWRRRSVWIFRGHRLVAACAPAGHGAQSGRRPLALGANGEVPGLYVLERIHHPDLDVRDACDLPAFSDTRKMAVDRCAQSDDDAGRSDQGHVLGQGTVISAYVALSVGITSCYCFPAFSSLTRSRRPLSTRSERTQSIRPHVASHYRS